MSPQEAILTALQKKYPMIQPEVADIAFEAQKDWMRQAYPLPKHQNPPTPKVMCSAWKNCVGSGEGKRCEGCGS